MRPTSLIPLPSVAIALCGALLQACGGGDEPAWAVQHATLEITNDGAEVAGYQIWEFYNSAWERTRSQDDHVCARVQSVYGAAEAVLPEGCPGCVASYAVALEELQTDCVGPEGGDVAVEEADGADKFRFRASGMASNRKRLGLSAADFGLLVGASGQSVYAWEQGKARPRGKNLAAIAALRGVGKREVVERLAALKSGEQP